MNTPAARRLGANCPDERAAAHQCAFGGGGLEYLLPWPRSAAQQRPDSSPRHLLWPGAKVKALESAAAQQSCHFSPGPEAPALDEGILEFSCLGMVHLHLQGKRKGFCWQQGSSVPVPAALLMLKHTVKI